MSKARVNYGRRVRSECGLGRACEKQAGIVERGEAPISWLTYESQGLPVQANILDRCRRKRRSIGLLYLKVRNFMICSQPPRLYEVEQGEFVEQQGFLEHWES
jgi:hypothetical protein